MPQKIQLLVCTLLLGSLSGCYGLLTGSCDDNVKSEAVSPGGRYTATVIERDCGATTDYSTLVNLRRASEPLKAGPESLILSLSGKQNVALAWADESQLTIGFPRVDTFTQKPSWGPVAIVYRHAD